MQDTKLFETILAIQPPWRISRVALDTSPQPSELHDGNILPLRRARPLPTLIQKDQNRSRRRARLDH